MTKVVDHIKPYLISEFIKTILKIKEDTLLFNIPLSFCKENKINPENLEFEIIKDSDKIMLVARTNEARQPSESNKPTRLKEVLSNV